MTFHSNKDEIEKFLFDNGFNQVASDMFLRSPLRIDVKKRPDGYRMNLWVSTQRTDNVSIEQLK
jgi:hypothetical protein